MLGIVNTYAGCAQRIDSKELDKFSTELELELAKIKMNSNL